MKYSFDLTAQPWIPCIMSDGTAVQVGLQEALSRAHEIREILAPSPLVTVSLHRLLLAILHRNFGPSDAQQWRDMWQSGQFAAEPLMQYFDKWRHRFDLFDSERPFYQYPGLPDKMFKSVALLAYELASGNNPTLFDHSLDNHPQALDAGQAACLVVATQSFHLGGLCATEQGNASATDAPLARGAVVILPETASSRH
jgi:CRISPR system Cascade subunit CasA